MAPLTVALIGAGGKMGTRIANNLVGAEAYRLVCSEKGEAGTVRLRERGLEVIPGPEAVRQAEAIVLAVPDASMGPVSDELLPQARAGSLVILLDPAAAAAGELFLRGDLDYVVCHPCHPPLFGEQASEEARRDFFGGIAATQDIVIALAQGREETFAMAEQLCRDIYAPVAAAHRVTVEQMALLEPTMAEVVAASAAVLMGEALEEAVRRGVPREAARAFMLGHAQVPLAIVFGALSSPFSDAAKIAIDWGTARLIQPDWRRVFEPDQVQAVVRAMLHPEESR
jgi:hypothetical protein